MEAILHWRVASSLCTILGGDTKLLETPIINEDDPGCMPPATILAPQE